METKSIQTSLITRGMALSLPIDSKPELKHKFLQNIRVTSDGFLRSRPRVADFSTLPGGVLDIVHTIKEVTDDANEVTIMIVAAADKLYTSTGGAPVLKDSGFSGNPLSIITYRPEQALDTYAYIADDNKFVKLSTDDVLSDVGIDPPIEPASVRIAQPIKSILDNITAGTLADWVVVNGVTSIESRVNTTISIILTDAGTPGFASIIPVAFSADIKEGVVLTINGIDNIVEKVIPSGIAAGVVTIESIQYVSGTTGLAYITLTTPITDIFVDSIIQLGGSEYVRVLDIVRGVDDAPRLKVSTIGTFAAGATITGFASFRIYATAAYAAGQAIVADSLKNAIAATGISTLTKTANYDLSRIGTNALSEDALFHISIKSTDLSKITEIQIHLGFDTTFVNYLQYVVSPNFLASSITNTGSTLNAQQQALQRRDIIREINRGDEFIDDSFRRRFGDEMYGPEIVRDFGRYIPDTTPDTPVETTLGQGAWTELVIPFKNFTRVGGDESVTRKDVKAIRISINAIAATDVNIDSIWIGGAGGGSIVGDIGVSLLDYNYIYRFRDPITGDKSNWSPPLRNGIEIKKDSLVITIPANTQPSTYKIDIARIGGTINEFKVLATIPNDGTTFTDDVPDIFIADNESAARFSSLISNVGDFDYFKPFAILDRPKTGVCRVVGTEFSRISGDFLDTSYPRGTQILIGDKLTKFYNNPSSTTKVSLEDNLGYQNNVVFEIKEPLLTGQALPIIAGPFGEGFSGQVIFGAGDINSPGSVYWLDVNSPDTMSDLNRLEITTPNEPIVNIVIYDSYPIIYTTKRRFILQPAQSADGHLTFLARESANSKGLLTKDAVCVARSHVYQLTDDGIYRTEGVGNPVNITDADLHSLFPHNGSVPVNIEIAGRIIDVPSYTSTDIKEHRLYSTDDHLFWRFKNKSGNQVCLVYDTRLEGWISYDIYVGSALGCVYKSEKRDAVNIYIGHAGSVKSYATDDTTAMTGESALISTVIPFANDLGDFRIQKDFYEYILDAKTGGGIVATIATDNATVLASPIDIDANLVRDLLHIDLNTDNKPLRARNIATFLEWTLLAGTEVYGHGYTFTPLGEVITDKPSDFEPDDIYDKFWQGVIIECDTFGGDKVLKYLDDNGSEKAELIINHNGRIVKSYSFDHPFISHKIRRVSDDDKEWMPLREVYVFDKEPELAKVWESQTTSYGIDDYKQIKTPIIGLISTTIVTVTITIDNVELTVYDIPSTNKDKKRMPFQVPANRFGLVKWRLESNEPFRLYKKDCEVLIRRWNGVEDFQVIRPFGDEDDVTQVRI